MLPPQVSAKICAYTKNIIIKDGLDWPSVVHLLQLLKDLKCLIWLYPGQYAKVGGTPGKINTKVLRVLQENWPNCTISIDNLCTMLERCYDTADLPSQQLVSYKTRGWLSDDLRSAFKKILLVSSQLKVLHLIEPEPVPVHENEPVYCFHEEEIDPGETIPAIQELFLEGPCWHYSVRTAAQFWNFSNLTYLRLEKVRIMRFLMTVPTEILLQLKTVITNSHVELENLRWDASLRVFNRSRRITALENLSLVSCFANGPYTAISNYCPSLRILELRDYASMNDKALHSTRP